jgi:hypothetical protein
MMSPYISVSILWVTNFALLLFEVVNLVDSGRVALSGIGRITEKGHLATSVHCAGTPGIAMQRLEDVTQLLEVVSVLNY